MGAGWTVLYFSHFKKQDIIENINPGEIRNFCRKICPLFSTSEEFCLTTRETRKGWPLLTVVNEVIGDSMSTNEKGPSLVGSLCLSYRYCSALAALVGPVQNIFPYCTQLIPVSSSPSKLGSQLCLGCLSLSVCLCSHHSCPKVIIVSKFSISLRARQVKTTKQFC
jgi:hypothetical protein